jgi:hypothetical protein
LRLECSYSVRFSQPILKQAVADDYSSVADEYPKDHGCPVKALIIVC